VRLPRLGALPAAIVLSSLIGLVIWATQPAPVDENAIRKTGLQTEQERFDQQLEEGLRAIRRKEAALSKIGQDLADGRLTLLEAASKARDLHRDDAEIFTEMFRTRNPTMSEAERRCREVIKYLPLSLPGGPDVNTLFAHFEAELELHLECGTLCLENGPSRADQRDP
jgi:hypothetical protein